MSDETWSPPAPGATPTPGPAPAPAPGAGDPPPFAAPPAPAGAWWGTRIRPWWGLGDVLVAGVLVLILATIGIVFGLPFISAQERSALYRGELETTPAALIASSLIVQQISQGALPFIISRWKGLGVASDWRLKVRPIDPLIGVGTALIAFALSALAGGLVSHLVHLANESDADNTQFLVDAKGTPWLWLFLFAVVLGAPFVEELFFRGLTMRAFEKRWGPVVGVIGSTVVFTIPHFQKFELAPTLVLFASIGCVGLVFGVVATSVKRLGPTIFAHMLFNAFGAASALGLFHRA